MPKCNLNKVANPIMFSSVFRGHQVETLTRNELKAFMQLVFTSYKLEKQETIHEHYKHFTVVFPQRA